MPHPTVQCSKLNGVVYMTTLLFCETWKEYYPLPGLRRSGSTEMASPSPFLRSLSVVASQAPQSVFSFNNLHQTLFHPRAPSGSRFTCQAGPTGFFTRLGRLIKEKTKSDVEKIFSGFSKTRDNLAVIDELLLYWNLTDTDRVLDELEEVLFSFSPRKISQFPRRQTEN